MPSARIELGKLSVHRHIKESLFHGRIRQAEPLLHEVNAQHGLERKGRATVFAFGVIRGNELDQCSPRNHQLHLGKKLVLSGSAGAQVQIKAGLLHGS